LARAAREANLALAIGVTERESTYSHAALYCSLLMFDASGELLLYHRGCCPFNRFFA
jgi:predicted amidohydrolase